VTAAKQSGDFKVIWAILLNKINAAKVGQHRMAGC
jgi:hypothetical protein